MQDENHRLYNIIDRMQSKGNDVQDAVNEATVLSKNHDKDRDGNAAIVKELETQNVKIQEEMTKLSDQALSLQNLSSRSAFEFSLTIALTFSTQMCISPSRLIRVRQTCMRQIYSSSNYQLSHQSRFANENENFAWSVFFILIHTTNDVSG